MCSFLLQILLKELEEFAFKGIPDVRGCAEITTEQITAGEVGEVVGLKVFFPELNHSKLV